MVEGKIEIHTAPARNGQPSVKVTAEDGSIKTLHSLYDPEAEARSIVDSFRFDGKGMLVVLGLGLGYHVAELAGKFPGAEIYVVEARPDIYELAKAYGPALNGNITYIVGHSPEEAVREIARHQMRGGIKSLSVFSLSSAVSAFPQWYTPVLTSLKNTMSVRLWERLRYPKFGAAALRVVLIDSGYFAAREAERALKALGHEVIKVKIKGGDDGEGPIAGFVNAILAFRPDFILTMNHLGFDEDGVLTSFFRSIEMPVASWFVDSPGLILKAFGENISPFVTLFSWDREYIRQMEEAGFEDVGYLPLASDEQTFRPMKLEQRLIERYKTDTAFVGNSLVNETAAKLQSVPVDFNRFIETAAQRMSRTRGPFGKALQDMDEKDLKEYESLSPRHKLDIEAAVLWRATLLYRSTCVRQLKEFDPCVYGDGGWKTLLENGWRVRPPLNYYSDLPVLYNCCSVNFNATHLQMGQAVNQRVFDVPACGAFLLTDHQKGLDELFDVGKEIAVYKDLNEIPELVRFYLDNQSARDAILNRGRSRVLREHTYSHRLDNLVRAMKGRYA